MNRLESTLIIPRQIAEVWDFFSSPANLEKITPPSMNFKILTPLPAKMYEGLLIGYKVSPFPFMRVGWVTEISRIRENEYFIDEQRKGPYSIWHHEHHFKVVETGVEMKDILYYSMPAGFLGQWIEKLLVARRVRQIFEFREKKVKVLFPAR